MSELKDSGQRKQFASGAVRDMQEGKGRCDLMPLEECSALFSGENEIPLRSCLLAIDGFLRSKDIDYLRRSILYFADYRGWSISNLLLEVSIHYEDGCKKYGERNWEAGLDLHCYINSGIRHLLKYRRGDTDEPHDRAFVWNMLGAMYTLKNHPDLDDIDLPEFRKIATEDT